MNRAHCDVFRNFDSERRCSHCLEWLPVDDFYCRESVRIRSWCKQCYMWGVVNRRRVKADPMVMLQRIWH
jgi:hypothetical protein